MTSNKNILFFANTNHNADCVREHINGLKSESNFNWFVVNSLTNRMAHEIDLNFFDAVGFHYSIHPHEEYYVSKELKQKVREFPGVVFQFLQDEYQNVHVTSQAMVEIGTDLLFTIVRPENHFSAYDHPSLINMKRVTVMAGYAPEPQPKPRFVPIKERSIDFFYRSRVCPLCSGSLGYEKSLIAKEVAKRSFMYGLNIDVSVQEEDRLYGSDWLDAMSSCRATLGSESGASIWDLDGSIEKAIDFIMGENPEMSFESLYEKLLKPFDGKLVYSSISPRIFEAAALKTPQVLFPGWYNGLMEPGKHYLLLEKDFSNFEEVVSFIRNDDLLEQIAENAYDELIASGKYTRKLLGGLVHDELSQMINKKGASPKKSLKDAGNEIRRACSIFPLANKWRNFQAEIGLAGDQFVSLINNPRYRGGFKILRMLELFKRYTTHLQPRLTRNFHRG